MTARIAFGCVVLDAKVTDRITNHELGQMLDHLKITGHPVGFTVHIKMKEARKNTTP